MKFLSWYEAEQILEGKQYVSLDLGITKQHIGPNDFDRALLEKIARDKENIYFEQNGKWFKAMIKTNKTYKLAPTQPNHAPMLVIAGIRMHCISEMPPEKNAEAIVNILKIKRGWNVLDICTGLGYTAIAAAKRGANVTSIEKDENVIELMKINPWSKPFFDLGVKLIRGDAFEVLPKLEKFDAVIHDPPRFALAPELYSLEFYKELAKHTKQMFHYTGNPGARYRRKRFLKGVSERLREAGWKPRYNKRLQGFFCSS